MSDTSLREPKQFGNRNEPKTISISSNGRTREYRINPAIFIVSACLFCMVMVGYMGSTAYLAFRDDLISSSVVRQARIKHEYEDRIAALRSKVDKITSRQMLDQQAVEAQVADLVKQQELLSGRSGDLNGLLKRAKQSGISTFTIPVPSENPLKADNAKVDMLKTGSIAPSQNFKTAFAGSFLRGSNNDLSLENGAQSNGLVALPSQKLFGAVSDQIKQVKQAQYANLQQIRMKAKQQGKEIARILAKLNVPVSQQSMENIGGPFEEARIDGPFDQLAEELLGTLDSLDNLKRTASNAPTGSPLPNAPVSSLFGNRVDPFHRTTAFHSGIDYKAKSGTPILASGNGVVTKASRNGGYGKMVILDHGNGITTRYAHMSRIGVKVGQRVAKGAVIGKVGSTGRSTGPHLHYEVRRGKKATNPSKFLKAGAQLKNLL